MSVSIANIIDYIEECAFWLDSIDFYIGGFYFTMFDVLMETMAVGMAFEAIYLLWHSWARGNE